MVKEITVDLTELFKMQNLLDEMIMTKHQLNKRDVTLYKKLALIDEIAELLNKTRIHKYWSLKGMEDREELLEEYVDGWHFVLSIGNDLGVPFLLHVRETKIDMINIFEELFNTCTFVYSSIGWQLTATMFYRLGESLGFDWEKDIIPAYYEKYEENQNRQANGY